MQLLTLKRNLPYGEQYCWTFLRPLCCFRQDETEILLYACHMKVNVAFFAGFISCFVNATVEGGHDGQASKAVMLITS